MVDPVPMRGRLISGQEATMKSRTSMLRRSRRSIRGQTATEYVMVIAVLSIAALAATGPFQYAFNTTMMTLSESLGTSLTQDGIRP
jgi:Flp pilus assembly pilin Flp